jgi:hypothetical protein
VKSISNWQAMGQEPGYPITRLASAKGAKTTGFKPELNPFILWIKYAHIQKITILPPLNRVRHVWVTVASLNMSQLFKF